MKGRATALEGVIRAACCAGFLLAATSAVKAANALDIKIGYLGTTEKAETISLLQLPAANDGLAGARLAIDDDNTTGKFLNQSFALEEILLRGEDDPVAAAQKF